MKPEVSLPCSQEPSISPNHEPDQSSVYLSYYQKKIIRYSGIFSEPQDNFCGP
jgi:hypothetical protein